MGLLKLCRALHYASVADSRLSIVDEVETGVQQYS